MTATPPTIALPADAACLGCGYSLQQLTVARCPECGRAFDPADVLSTHNSRRTSILRRRRSALPMAVFAITSVFCALLLMGFVFPLYSQRGSIILASLAVGLWARSAVRQEILYPHLIPSDRRDRIASKWVAISLLTLGLLMSLTPKTCCHGSLVAIGPIAITHTSPVGMCRNGIHLGDRHRVSETLSWYWITGRG